MSGEDDSIEQAVTSRRERLLALRTAQELLLSSNPEPTDTNQHEEPQPPPTGSEDDEEHEQEYAFIIGFFLNVIYI